jgi:hypothetical protein
MYFGKSDKTDRAIVQATRCWILTAEIRVQSRVTSSEIRAGRSDIEAGFSQSPSVSPAKRHSTIAPYSSITEPRGVW